MCVSMLIGVYAWMQKMDVAVVSVWGILCAFNFIFDLILVVTPLALRKVEVNGGFVAMNLYIGMVHIASALFALHLYHVNAAQIHKDPRDHHLSGFDPLGRLFDTRDPEVALANAAYKVEHMAVSAVSRHGTASKAGHTVPDEGVKAIPYQVSPSTAHKSTTLPSTAPAAVAAPFQLREAQSEENRSSFRWREGT